MGYDIVWRYRFRCYPVAWSCLIYINTRMHARTYEQRRCCLLKADCERWRRSSAGDYVDALASFCSLLPCCHLLFFSVVIFCFLDYITLSGVSFIVLRELQRVSEYVRV